MTANPQSPAAEAYPLAWPAGWKRTKSRVPASFKMKSTDFARIRDSISRNLSLMGARYPVLSTNVELRLDGLPYAGRREPDDPGVAVYWYDPRSKRQRVMACDRWNRVVHNLRSIELSLEAIRGLERWGSSEIVERAFSGFKALPAVGHVNWRETLGFPSGIWPSAEALKERYHDCARQYGEEHMQHLLLGVNQAYEAAKKELGY